jgi:hypothetical protein
VDPPAPKVTDTKSGFRSAKTLIVFSNLAAPFSDLAGNNSKESVGFRPGLHMSVILIALPPFIPFRTISLRESKNIDSLPRC